MELMCTGILAEAMVAAATGGRPTAPDWTGAGPRTAADARAPSAWHSAGLPTSLLGKTNRPGATWTASGSVTGLLVSYSVLSYSVKRKQIQT